MFEFLFATVQLEISMSGILLTLQRDVEAYSSNTDPDDAGGKRRPAQHHGPRQRLSSDTKLASLVVLNEDGEAELMAPRFRDTVHAFRNAVALPAHSKAISIFAAARDRGAMVNIYRWDPTCNKLG